MLPNKQTKMNLAILLMAAALSMAAVSYAAPMGTAFTYQGRLADANSPAEGLYDLEFAVFDALDGGSQQGGTVDVNDLDVIDGYFTVTLDFGAGVFTGDARWLQIAVRPGGSTGDFTTLSPRQELTPAPYALYAKTAGTDSDWTISGSDMYTDAGVSGNVGIGTTSPRSHLHIDNLLDATESGVSNLALLLRHRTITAGGGPGIGFSSDNTTSIGAKIVHVRTSSNSMGDLAFYTKPSTSGPTTEKMRIKDTGNVGIGTTTPSTKLDVAGTVNATAFTGDGSALTGIAGDADWTINGSDMYTGASVTGNVGIGTTSPQNKLDVAGRTTMRTDTGDSTKVLIFDNFLGAMRIYTDSSAGTAKDLILGTYPNGHVNQLFLQQSTGNVGIGTASPQGKLDVNGTIFQSGSVLHADYVFEDSYELESIEEHSEFMWRNKHLAAIPKATVDAQGREIVEIGSHRKGIVEELEKAHIYIEQLDNKNKTLEQRVEKLENVISKLLGNKEGVL